MRLHEAIDLLLAEKGSMYARELAAEIERRGLYIKPSDGEPAPTRQIHARVGNKTYRDRYRRDGSGRISLA